MESSKKVLLSVVGIAVMIVLVTGITFSFFNYTRTGSSNVIKVGRISFISKNEQTINLSNLFPIDPEETGIMNDSTKVGTYTIEIKGDTVYTDGIEYLVSAVDANIYTATGKIVPLSLDVTVTNLGTENANYFTARNSNNTTIYKKIVGDTLVGDQMLLVGYIKPNTTSGTAEGVNGSITIKAYLDENKILISDTYDGTESDNMGTLNSMAEGKTVLTTAEWNALGSSGISFKVKVEANEGIWVNGSLEEIMRMNNIGIDTENGVDFSKTSEEDGTNGVYTFAATQNDTNPVLYYRGDVEDNNVLFGNQCWKAVRTTDTGGVKLIYNGELRSIYDYANAVPLEENEYTITNDDYGFVYNQNDKKYVATIPSGSYNLGYFSFNVPNGDGYYAKVEIAGNHESDGGYYYLDYDGSWNNYDYVNEYPYEKYWSLGTLTSSNTISFYDSLIDANYGPLTIKIQFLKNAPVIGHDCNNNELDSLIKLNVNGTYTNRFSFNTSADSPAYSGYMYGNVYSSKTKLVSSGTFKFGSNFEYINGIYRLVDSEDSLSNNRHYTCFNTTGICDGETSGKIYYVHYGDTRIYYYIELTNGKNIEDAFREMYTNSTNSNAKTIIDSWYLENMHDFTNKLEDTIYCNDRSWNTLGQNQEYINNSFIPNGGIKNASLMYSPYGRGRITYNPSLSCAKNDAFTVNNNIGNQNLTYPIGLLTSDEAIMAGAVYNKNNDSLYLNSDYSYWLMSPFTYYHSYASIYNFTHYSNGTQLNNESANESGYKGFRPVISIKPGQLITKGDGTVTNPYVIE